MKLNNLNLPLHRLALMSSQAYFELTDDLTDLDLSPRMPWHAHSHEVCVHLRLGGLCLRPRKDLTDPTEDPYLGKPVSRSQFLCDHWCTYFHVQSDKIAI